MSIKRVVALVLLGLLLGLFVLQANRVPSLLQYAFLPPDLKTEQAADGGENEGEKQQQKEEETPLEGFLKTWETFLEEQGESVSAAALTAHFPSAELTTAWGGSAKAEVTAVYGDLHTLDSGLFINGRALYQEEADAGKQVAVIDEALAIALFRQGNPVNMKLKVFNREFTVIGVIRHSRNAGERAGANLFLPLKAFSDQPSWEVFIAQLRVTGGSGTRAGLSNNLAAFRPGGQAIDLVKEKYRTTLPLRVLLCALGFVLALLGIKVASLISKRLIQTCRERLTSHYAARLLPLFIGVGLLILLMFALGLGALAFTFSKLLEPVYVFPEWVPAVLVETKEIMATFWNNRVMATGLVSLRSRELLFLQFLRGVITVLTLLAGWALVVPLNKLFALVKPEHPIEDEA